MDQTTRRRQAGALARPRAHLVASAVAHILVVMILLLVVLVIVGRNASTVAARSKRANTAAAVASDLEAVGLANTELQSAFDRAVGVEPASARALQFSTASSLGIAGTGAFSTYSERSLHLRSEPAARAAYQRATDAWNKVAGQFGPALVNAATSTDAITLGIVKLRTLQDARQARLADLRGMYLAEATHDQLRVATGERTFTDAATRAAAGVLVCGLGLIVVGARRATRRGRDRARVERERAAIERRTDFESRLQRAMALAIDEVGVRESVEHTLAVVGYQSAELLVAENDTEDFERVVPPLVGSGCGVEHAADCAAVRLRQKLEFADSDAIDACPFLRRRTAEVHQCVCVPITIDDQTLAVLRAEAPVGTTLSLEQADWITILARNLGERTSALRVVALSQHQAATDPLTRLANRRTLERAIDAGMASKTYAVVFADIDHFKDLNDTYGHEAGDECLRAFARVLGHATRPGDVSARYGGEEFVVLLPDATAADAVNVAERIQALLVAELETARISPFTVSMGVASTDRGSSVEDIVRAADHAMYTAKAAGRNQIIVDAA